MINASPINLKPFNDLTAFARQYPARIRAVTRTEFAAPTGKAALLNAVKPYPGTQAAEPWGGWSNDPAANERARKMYFYLIAQGLIQTDGHHYIRTGALADAYSVDLSFEGTAAVVAVSNSDDRAYKFTKGKRQIPGAKKTGWQKDALIIKTWVRDFTAAVVAGARTVKIATT